MLAKGATVGAYIIEGPLGSGGMATVYRVRHSVLGSEHALKILRADLVKSAQIRARFLDEGRLLAQLRHPGLVRVTDIVSEPDLAALVMDLMVGQSLADVLARGPLSVTQAAGIALQVLAALDHIHAHDIVHRDLKPSNLFVTPAADGRVTVRVLDFGIAKVSGQDRTRSQATMGTYAYMSPEQIRNPASVDRRSDLFAMGAVIYEMVTGEPAFTGDTDYETMQRVVDAAYTPVSAHLDSVPAALTEAIGTALQRDPADRFADARAFAATLRGLANPDDLRLADGWQREAKTQALHPGSDPGSVGPTGGPRAATSSPAQRGPSTTSDWMLSTLRGPADDADAPPADWAQTADDDAFVVSFEPDDPNAPRSDRWLRIGALLQVGAGLLNVGVLWLVACMGFGRALPSLLQSIGASTIFVWGSQLTALLAFGLFAVGVLELIVGVATLLFGATARQWQRAVAWLELASLMLGGLPSFCVALAVFALQALDARQRGSDRARR